jgi:magnesium chelatase family protein
MLFKTRSAAVYGIEAYLVDVEVNLTTGGNGSVVIVGLPDTAVRESRNRVLPAIKNNGYGAPYQRIVINLGPADVKKEGSAFDLPMAIGILGGYGLLAKQDVSDYLMVGELSLDGKLRPVKGVLSIAMLARDRKIPHVLVPLGNAREAAVVEGVAVYPVRTLTEVVEFINGTRTIDPVRAEQCLQVQEPIAGWRIFVMCVDNSTPSVRSKSPWPAGTTCSLLVRREPGRPCSRNGSRPSFPR